MKKGRVIDDPIACTVRGCWTTIDRKWRICARCWGQLPKPVRGVLATLREWCGREPAQHPQDPQKPNTSHYLYRLVWRDAMRFLETGGTERGTTLPWRVGDGSSFERGPFHRHHDEARAYDVG